MLPAAAVFDNDGLLLDTEEAWTRAEVRLFERHGSTFTPAHKRDLIGSSHLVAAGKLEAMLDQPGNGEALIDEVSERFEPPTEFVVPGQNRVSAQLDVARTVARRAERDALAAAVPGSAVLPYLNRVSDLLWTLARWQEGTSLPTRSVDPT